MLKIDNVKVSDKQRVGGEEILANLPSLNAALKNPEVGLEEVRRLIRIEADGKRRMTTLQRLVARFNVLEAKQNEAELFAYVANKTK